MTASTKPEVHSIYNAARGGPSHGHKQHAQKFGEVWPWGADSHMALLMPLPLTIYCSSKSRLVYLPGFAFLVLTYPGSPGQSPGAVKWL